ncbi:MAG: ATP-dependent DNA ligase, partial [Proteobacteria bacterium]
IEQTNSTNEKVACLVDYFKVSEPADAAWALYFLSGRRPKKFLSSGTLRTWAEELAKIPSWLADECYSAVGDSAEMISLILAPFKTKNKSPEAVVVDDATLEVWINQRIYPLRQEDESVQKAEIQRWWQTLGTYETFVLNKLITGGLRIGVSETLVYRALSQAFDLPRSVVASRLLGEWKPSPEFYKRAIRVVDENEVALDADDDRAALPVPFCLAAPMEHTPEELGAIEEWQLEWKWDGIRAQVVKRGARVEIWSRGEERATDSFPDLVERFSRVDGDFILDGEIVAGVDAIPGSFNDLQKRLNRKSPSAALTAKNPVSFLAYDFLLEGSESLTELPLSERRTRMHTWMEKYPLDRVNPSPTLDCQSWSEAAELRTESRNRHAEGLMIKKKNSIYTTGRKRGVWFKWKIDPLTLDVVLTAAQPGTGRRASLYTDYTFSIWKDDQLVPIAKAYSGLTDAEIREVDSWIRKNTTDRFGPVRMLKPERVFEIGFEGIGQSSRHKSGFAVRFPRILRERTDKPAVEADRVETVQALLRSINGDEEIRADNPDLFSVAKSGEPPRHL